jgi:uncharacterized NAD(P)/FAD-binding protein YdhS
MGEATAGGLLWESLDDTGRKSQLIAMTRRASEMSRKVELLEQQLAEARAALDALRKTLHGAYELLSVVTDDLREAAEAGGDRE